MLAGKARVILLVVLVALTVVDQRRQLQMTTDALVQVAAQVTFEQLVIYRVELSSLVEAEAPQVGWLLMVEQVGV
jgi:hypothetical protein